MSQDAYDVIDEFLRNNLDDDDYAQYSKALDELAAQPVTHVIEEQPMTWYEGAPPFPQSEEWFIAETTYGDRVVLRALPEDYSYDFKTADDTYIKRDKIKCWMQFPDSEYVPPSQPVAAQPDAITKLQDSINGNIELVLARLGQLHKNSIPGSWRELIEEAMPCALAIQRAVLSNTESK